LSNVRVTYSGLIGFAVTLVSVVTGTIFVVIVTRRLDLEDFGLWTLIGSLVSYVTVVEPIVTYWTTRQIARGEKVGKTALATSGIFSIGGIIVYTILAFYVSTSLDSDLGVLMIASILIPISFMNNILNSICAGFKPQLISYGMVTFETSKTPLGILFVILVPLGIIGVLITVILANSIRMITLFIIAREQIVVGFKRVFIKFWLRMSWLTLYMSAHGLIYKLDVLIFSLITKSFVGLAFWGASSSASKFVSYAGSISQGLYPKLIATGKKQYAEQSLKRSMYFAIPLVGASIVFAKPALHMLNPLYIDGSYIVMILGLRSLVNVLTGFFFGILESYEKVDIDKKATFKMYFHSRIFKVPTLWLIMSISYVGSLSLYLILLWKPTMQESSTVLIWAMILLFITTPFMLYGMIMVKKKHNVVFPYKTISKYTGVTILSSIIIVLVSENWLTYPESIWDFLPEIIPLIIFGGAIYFGITYLIDDSTRKLFKSIIREIINK